MKTISAAVIVLAGAAMITGGAFIGHNQTQLFVQSIGCLLGLVGLVGWFVTMTRPDGR